MLHKGDKTGHKRTNIMSRFKPLKKCKYVLSKGEPKTARCPSCFPKSGFSHFLKQIFWPGLRALAKAQLHISLVFPKLFRATDHK